jgi:hypothetical protein
MDTGAALRYGDLYMTARSKPNEEFVSTVREVQVKDVSLASW